VIILTALFYIKTLLNIYTNSSYIFVFISSIAKKKKLLYERVVEIHEFFIFGRKNFMNIYNI